MGQFFREALLKCLEEMDLALSDYQLSQCEAYRHLLLEWNQKMNLTSIEGDEETAVKHFADSFICVKHINRIYQGKIIDVGTGAGFPGIPIKILCPEMELTLLDSLAKRCLFLNSVAASLNLETTTVVHGRAEDKGKDQMYREQYTMTTARAVSNLPVLAEYCLPFVKVGGVFLALKGPDVEAEVKSAKKAVAVLGGRFREITHYQLPLLGDRRSLVIIEKVSSTPEKYPRKPGLPEKKPIF